MISNERLTRWLGVLGFIVAAINACVTIQQSRTSNRNYARSAGNVPVRLANEGIYPAFDEIDPSLKVPLLDTGRTVIKFTALRQFYSLNPFVRVRNDGDEPVAAIRIQTRFMRGFIDAREDSAASRGEPNPWVFDQQSSKEYTLDRPLRPGETATIPISPGLLAQMLQAQDPRRGDRLHYGVFEIRSFGKLVGADHFDQADSRTVMGMSFTWIPNGFKEADVKRFLESFRPHVDFDE